MTADNILGSIRQDTRDFLAKPLKLLIGGRWVDAVSGKTFPVYDPGTGRQIASVAEADAADVDRAVAAARAAFESKAWRDMKACDRERLLHRLADLIEANADQLAELESLDNGKSVMMARHLDIVAAVDFIRYMAGWPTKNEGATIPVSMPYVPDGKFFAYTQREPVGVVGQIIPWNFPLLMAAWKLAPALAAGCATILKPAEQTPVTALRIGELILEAGFPEGVVNILPGYGHTAGAAIAAHAGIDKVAFTGSTEVGRLITQAAMGNLKKVTLELGGKSPAIVLDDADLDIAIPGAAMAIFFNQGQVCAAGSRLYVHKSIFDKVIDGVAGAAKQFSIGHGLSPTTQMGPLVSEEQVKRVCGYIDGGLADGAKAVVGGRRLDQPGYFVEPTVLVNTQPSMKVVQEEIFGPVVVAMPYSDLDEVVAAANNSIYGLAASIWTRDVSKVHRIAPALKAGTVWVNCHGLVDAAMPFGGYKQSGWGRELGKAAIDGYTETKSVCLAY
ncbi:aldehyde dehydrogenase family protein [Magnetospirillum sp. SS-4]|uniref:aldehyde dehydrogenase family protein n=1 Tax=Magnetospirillum sp. SS-4 TaxID=2681465 RepID=UPI0013853C15|nr:aldehyde dehydrogenase family protein [Magnetospirillum sp. SS-4]CAA7612323.1 putative aldehyde dehydrogenase DhaS [Magnetospirillum sp. SS-4]